MEYRADSEALAEIVDIGDNVVVLAHSKLGEVHWLYQCDKSINEVAKTLQDRFGNSYLIGEFVITYWYKILKEGSRTLSQ